MTTEDVVSQALTVQPPDDTLLEQFRSDVKAWIDIDNAIKRLDAAAKERKKAKKDLSGKILRFMETYNVEDLNTREGRLRYKVTNVMSPLGQKAIRERLHQFISTKFGGDVSDEVTQAVFAREKTEKVTLRRLGRSLTLS